MNQDKLNKICNLLFGLPADELVTRETYSHTTSVHNEKRGETYSFRTGAISSTEEAKNRAKMILLDLRKGGCTEDEALSKLVEGNAEAKRLLAHLNGETGGDVPRQISVKGGPANSKGLFYGSPSATVAMAVKKAVGNTYDPSLFSCPKIETSGKYVAVYDGHEIEVEVS